MVSSVTFLTLCKYWRDTISAQWYGVRLTQRLFNTTETGKVTATFKCFAGPTLFKRRWHLTSNQQSYTAKDLMQEHKLTKKCGFVSIAYLLNGNKLYLIYQQKLSMGNLKEGVSYFSILMLRIKTMTIIIIFLINIWQKEKQSNGTIFESANY